MPFLVAMRNSTRQKNLFKFTVLKNPLKDLAWHFMGFALKFNLNGLLFEEN